MNSNALKTASALFMGYMNDIEHELDRAHAVRLCNQIFDVSSVGETLSTGLFCIRYVNFVLDHSDLINERESLAAYQWSGVTDLFSRDPSDPDIILACALYQLNNGETRRALQLLDRLSRSGLRHRALSVSISQSVGR